MIRRRAYTLVELVTVMSIGSVLLVLSINVVHKTLDFSSVSQDRDLQSRSLVRLNQAFRQDVRRSSSHTLGDDGALKLRMPDESQITYRVETNRVVRVHQTDDQTTSQEQYQLREQSIAEITEISDPPARFQLEVWTETKVASAPRRLERVITSVAGGFAQGAAP